LDVLADRSPDDSLSGFMARHIEQPGSRQSAPAARKMRSSPSASAAAFTAWLPGTTMTLGTVTLRPSITAAAARRSSMRELVHEPMKTVSGRMSLIAVPAARPMYVSAREAASRSFGSEKDSGSGTAPSIVVTWPGFVPQVTWGWSCVASIETSLSQAASVSDESVRQCSSASSQRRPVGAHGRPSR
jgi:hypothetical protein